MKKDGKKSLLSRLTGTGSQPVESSAGAEVPIKLTGSALEQAYRDLLLENQMLVESNLRLHERLARRESGVEDSPATRELIRAQRNALADRSHQLREARYESEQLKRKQKKLYDENRRLSASLARHMEDIQPLLRREELSRRELAEAQEKLRQQKGELAKLTDKYYQLEARSKPQPPPSSAANSDF